LQPAHHTLRVSPRDCGASAAETYLVSLCGRVCFCVCSGDGVQAVPPGPGGTHHGHLVPHLHRQSNQGRPGHTHTLLPHSFRGLVCSSLPSLVLVVRVARVCCAIQIALTEFISTGKSVRLAARRGLHPAPPPPLAPLSPLPPIPPPPPSSILFVRTPHPTQPLSQLRWACAQNAMRVLCHAIPIRVCLPLSIHSHHPRQLFLLLWLRMCTCWIPGSVCEAKSKFICILHL
jgi:hypothetical protein